LVFEFLNSILALTNCQAVVAIFLELVATVGLIELPETKDKTAEKAAKLGVAAGTAAS
jgi:hypothetical protein